MEADKALEIAFALLLGMTGKPGSAAGMGRPEENEKEGAGGLMVFDFWLCILSAFFWQGWRG
jgi:hypothetical protein